MTDTLEERAKRYLAMRIYTQPDAVFKAKGIIEAQAEALKVAEDRVEELESALRAFIPVSEKYIWQVDVDAINKAKQALTINNLKE